MRSRTWGWSLVEILVVLGLLALFTVVVARTLGASLRFSRQELERSTAHGSLMVCLSTMERILQRSCVAGVAWRPGSPALLAVHTQPEGKATASPLWDASWTCFLWGERQLWQRTSPPFPALTPPPIERPQAPAGGLLGALTDTPWRGSRLLARQVSEFQYSLSPGPIVNLRVEVEFLPPGRSQPERLRMERHLYLRNGE
jgi:type II secretory pathway pseudopilin PulG